MGKKATNWMLLLNVLRDGQFHSIRELVAGGAGWRYGARIYWLKQRGYVFEKRRDPQGFDEWRLVSCSDVGTLLADQMEYIERRDGLKDAV